MVYKSTMKNKFKDFPLIKESRKTITQFYPHIPKTASKAISKVFQSRALRSGQGSESGTRIPPAEPWS